MHRSIMQDLDGNICFICKSVGAVEVHHCFHGTANRRLAEKDGLLVNLCPDCHRSLHDRGLYDDLLMEIAEAAWLDYYDKDVQEFIARYGKNYI